MSKGFDSWPIWDERTSHSITVIITNKYYRYYAPRPAEGSEAGRGAFYFSPYSDSYQVTTGTVQITKEVKGGSREEEKEEKKEEAAKKGSSPGAGLMAARDARYKEVKAEI